MSYRVWGDVFTSGDLTGTTRSQIIEPQADLWLAYVRCQLVVYNDPTFTDLTCKIYSDEAGSPSTLLYSSTTTLTKAELITEDNGARECGFAFNGEPMTAGVKYHVVINGTGYSPTSTKFLAWAKAYPEPVNDVTGESLEIVKVGVWPYACYLVGSRT